MDLSSASFAYPRHSTDTRALVAERMAERTLPEGVFVLSTCLRLELVASVDSAQLEATVASLEEGISGPGPVIRSGRDAATHLFRVASGLESPLLGEIEILTQFRQALIEAEAAGQVDGIQARLLEAAVSAGRRARQLLPASPHGSLAAIAAQTVGPATSVAVLGSGEMAVSVIDALLQLPAPPQVSVACRSPEKIESKPGVEVHDFGAALTLLGTHDAVVSAMSARMRPVDDDDLAQVVAGRSRHLTLVDMAMPPDLRPPESALLTYVDIDGLASMAGRRPRSDEADAFVDAAADEAYRAFERHHEIGPLITSMISRADRLVDETVRRFSGRLHSPEDESVLRQAAHTTARTLLADAVSYVKSPDVSSNELNAISTVLGEDDA